MTIDSRDRLYSSMLREPFAKVRTVFIQRARVEADRRVNERIWLEERGFEVVETTAGQRLTDDGREILSAHGKSWALKPEIHAQRLAAAFAAAKRRDAAVDAQQAPPAEKISPPSVCTAVFDGVQVCGGNLVLGDVCPNCALGKSGVAATLTCDVCGRQIAIMRGGK